MHTQTQRIPAPGLPLELCRGAAIRPGSSKCGCVACGPRPVPFRREFFVHLVSVGIHRGKPFQANWFYKMTKQDPDPDTHHEFES